mmetsp:Transcript_18407/g.28236  ORF Transcript_18407/g.28236 Transcript_18407/m.28236 type:complete len:226 (+) Transcript_18407:221-898(+)
MSGIIGDDRDIQRRIKAYGRNFKTLPRLPSLLDSIKQTASDKIWWVVLGTAGLLALFNGFYDGFEGAISGISIVLATLFIISVTSLADFRKDRRFVQLQSLIKDELISVTRGKYGVSQSVNMWDLVVGDVILIGTGERVPADCVVIEQTDLSVDLPAHLSEDKENHDGEILEVRRGFTKTFDDRILFADSIITGGSCKAIVCCVGETCSRYDVENKMDTDSDTPL